MQTTLTFLFFAVNVEKHHTPRARVHVCLYPCVSGTIAANRCPVVRYFSVSYIRTRTYEALSALISRGPSVCLIRWATVSFVWFSGYFSVFGVYPLFLSLNVRVFMSSLSMLDIILAHVMKLIYNSRIVRGAYLLVLSIQRARFMKKGPGLLIMYFGCLQWVPRTACGHSVYFPFLVLMTSKFILIPFIWWDPAYHIDLGRYKVSGILPTLTC